MKRVVLEWSCLLVIIVLGVFAMNLAVKSSSHPSIVYNIGFVAGLTCGTILYVFRER